MLHPSTKRLIDKLSDMTRRQRVAWTEGESAAVVHDTEGYRVVITPEPHAVLLTDGMGREIESCTPEEFASELDAQGRPYSRFIAELYRDAHRHARGTEKAISALLAGLEAVEEAAPVWPVADLGGDAPDSTTDETALIESETAITAAVANLADQINGGAAPAAEAPEPETPAAMADLTAPVEETAIEAAAPPEPAAPPAPETAVPDVALQAPEAAQPEPAPEPDMVAVSSFSEEAPAASVEVAPLAEEPGSFGTFGAFLPSTGAPDAETATETFAAEAPVEPNRSEIEEPGPAAREPELQAENLAPPAAVPEPLAEPTLAAPTLAQPISLSSIPFGFGLGAAQRSGAPSHPAPAPASVAPAPEPETMTRGIIDGTLDLPEPDMMALEEAPEAEPFASQMPKLDFDDLPNEPPAHMVDPNKPRRFNPWN